MPMTEPATFGHHPNNQQLRNADDPAVRAGIDLARLMDLPSTLAGLRCDSHAEYVRIANMLERVIRSLKPVATDQLGFRIMCEETQLIWLRAPYVRQLAAGDVPCPRYQDVPAEHAIVGRPPKGRKLAVSHGWDAAFHISPSNDKIRALASALEQLGATGEEDGVFLDFTSLPQGAAPRMPALYLDAHAVARAGASNGQQAAVARLAVRFGVLDGLAAVDGRARAGRPPCVEWSRSIGEGGGRVYRVALGRRRARSD